MCSAITPVPLWLHFPLALRVPALLLVFFLLFQSASASEDWPEVQAAFARLAALESQPVKAEALALIPEDAVITHRRRSGSSQSLTISGERLRAEYDDWSGRVQEHFGKHSYESIRLKAGKDGLVWVRAMRVYHQHHYRVPVRLSFRQEAPGKWVLHRYFSESRH